MFEKKIHLNLYMNKIKFPHWNVTFLKEKVTFCASIDLNTVI